MFRVFRANIGKIILALLLAGLTVLSLNYDRDVPDPAFLARDVFFKIGNETITVPVIAVQNLAIPPSNNNPLPHYSHSPIIGIGREFATREYKTAMVNLAGDPDAPASINGIKLSIAVYGTHGERTVSSQICLLLTKEWSQKACINDFSDALETIPREFYLTSEDGLEYYNRVSLGGLSNMRRNDLVDAMRPLPIQTQTVCAEGRKFCMSSTVVSKNLYAVWNSMCGELTIVSCERSNAAKGRAIHGFVRNELMIR